MGRNSMGANAHGNLNIDGNNMNCIALINRNGLPSSVTTLITAVMRPCFALKQRAMVERVTASCDAIPIPMAKPNVTMACHVSTSSHF